jgi:hypothetical protein
VICTHPQENFASSFPAVFDFIAANKKLQELAIKLNRHHLNTTEKIFEAMKMTLAVQSTSHTLFIIISLLLILV